LEVRLRKVAVVGDGGVGQQEAAPAAACGVREPEKQFQIAARLKPRKKDGKGGKSASIRQPALIEVGKMLPQTLRKYNSERRG